MAVTPSATKLIFKARMPSALDSNAASTESAASWPCGRKHRGNPAPEPARVAAIIVGVPMVILPMAMPVPVQVPGRRTDRCVREAQATVIVLVAVIVRIGHAPVPLLLVAALFSVVTAGSAR